MSQPYGRTQNQLKGLNGVREAGRFAFTAGSLFLPEILPVTEAKTVRTGPEYQVPSGATQWFLRNLKCNVRNRDPNRLLLTECCPASQSEESHSNCCRRDHGIS